MGQNIDRRMREGLKDSFGHIALVHAHFRVNGGNDHIDLFKQIIRQVEGSIRKNIDFAAGENRDAGDLRPGLLDLFALPFELLRQLYRVGDEFLSP